MFDRIQRFLNGLDGRPAGSRTDDPRVAAAALLVHVANADGLFSAEERERLTDLLRREFAIAPSEAASLIEEARLADAEAVDLYAFTSVLMARMDEDERRSIVDAIWSMIYADDGLHELEDNLAWRISELLGISSHDRIALKRRAASREKAAS